MERPSKRQKLSNSYTEEQRQYSSITTSISKTFTASSTLSRTLDLAEFQRPYLVFEKQDNSRSPQRRRTLGRIILPRAPDVTVTADVLEVAVNGGSTSTQIPVPTVDVALTLSSLGTLTVPAQTPASSLSSSSNLPASQGSLSNDSSSSLLTSTRNTTLLSSVTDSTVTITATSTFRVSYTNGTFIAVTSTQRFSQSTLNSKSLSYLDTIRSTATQSLFSFDPNETSTPDATSLSTDVEKTAGVAATATKSSSHGSSTSDGGGGGDGGSGPALTPQQTQMVGGIVGGLAGIALVAFAMLYLLRWYRARLTSKTGRKRLIDFDPAHDHGSSGLVNAAGPMSTASQSSFAPAAGALISSSKKWRNGLESLSRSGPTSPESEKGFQRISGRKIPPVLSTGGDQYGDPQSSNPHLFDEKVGVAISTTNPHQVPARLNQRVLSDASIYSDFDDPYVNGHHYESFSEPTTPVRSTMVLYSSSGGDRFRRPPLSLTRSYQDIAMEDLGRALSTEVSRPDGFAVIRESPARTPVTQSPSTSSIALPFQAPVTMDDDIPEMPLTPLSPGHPTYGLGLGHDLLARRIPSRVSARSTSSNGRFREELS